MNKRLYLRGSGIFVQVMVGLAVVLNLIYQIVGIPEPKVMLVTLLIAIGFGLAHLLASVLVQ